MRAVFALFAAGCVATATIDGVADTVPDDPVGDTARYEAQLLATALDRMLVVRFDDEADECSMLVFARPMWPQPWAAAVSTPPEWALESGGARTGQDCDPWAQLPTIPAQEAWGWATWTTSTNGLPRDVDLDIVLVLEGDESVHFDVEGLTPSW